MNTGRLDYIRLLDLTLFRLWYFWYQIKHSNAPFPQNKFLNPQDYQTSRILILRPGGIGDALLTLPFFKELKKLLPQAKIDVLVMKRNAGIIKNFPYFEKILIIDERKSLLANLRHLKKQRYHLCFNLDQAKYDYITPVLCGFTKSDQMIGFDIKKRARFYTHRVVYKTEEYEPQSLMNLLNYLKKEQTAVQISDLLHPQKEQFVNEAKALLPQYQLPENFLSLSLGALKKENKFPRAKEQALIEKLSRLSCPLVFLGGAEDRVEVQKITENLKNKTYNLCGQLSLSESLGMMGLSKGFVGYDAGPLHMAIAMNCKTVSVWGPTVRAKWGPPTSSSHLCLVTKTPYAPCWYHKFPNNLNHSLCRGECLAEISIEQILNAVKKTL